MYLRNWALWLRRFQTVPKVPSGVFFQLNEIAILVILGDYGMCDVIGNIKVIHNSLIVHIAFFKSQIMIIVFCIKHSSLF